MNKTVRKVLIDGLSFFIVVFLLAFFWTAKGHFWTSFSLGVFFGILGGLNGAYDARRNLEKEKGIKHSHWLAEFIASLMFLISGLIGDFGSGAGAMFGRTAFIVIGCLLLILSLVTFFRRKTT